jgi:hypothetical protein
MKKKRIVTAETRKRMSEGQKLRYKMQQKNDSTSNGAQPSATALQLAVLFEQLIEAKTMNTLVKALVPNHDNH